MYAVYLGCNFIRIVVIVNVEVRVPGERRSGGDVAQPAENVPPVPRQARPCHRPRTGRGHRP